MCAARPYRAGESVEDYCRACKTDRLHTVIAADAQGQPIRVMCGYCRSEHNYRGGPRIGVSSAPRPSPTSASTAGSESASTPAPARVPERQPRAPVREALPVISERERIGSPMSSEATVDLEMLLRRIIREETGITPVAPAEKWRGGTFVLRPGTPGLQEKSWPIETFFHKVVMLRNRLRTLEQHVNASDLPDDVKVRLQGYITGCYGTLTSFNVLFAEEEDHFKGAGGE
ncbi:MAG TPA: hypothetical protein VMO26_26760 [Vicinamibacterales bacterium]|nr:hypothetical protein [Vicinamibacterales bacterium]